MAPGWFEGAAWWILKAENIYKEDETAANDIGVPEAKVLASDTPKNQFFKTGQSVQLCSPLLLSQTSGTTLLDILVARKSDSIKFTRQLTVQDGTTHPLIMSQWQSAQSVKMQVLVPTLFPRLLYSTAWGAVNLVMQLKHTWIQHNWRFELDVNAQHIAHFCLQSQLWCLVLARALQFKTNKMSKQTAWLSSACCC